ncbi:hypothetical protein PINS_up010989 [Pythium insidiosum]|nr:hypothetical protein PINS_up010989 [Pythium insidiosum]
MPSQIVRFVMATVALALVATVVALSVPSVRSSIWGGGHVDLLLTTKKDVLDLQSKTATGAPKVDVLVCIRTIPQPSHRVCWSRRKARRSF